MTRTLVRDLPSHIGSRITVFGWVDTARLQRTMQFVLVRDHTGVVQVTNRRTDPPSDTETALENVPTESAVKVTGVVRDNPVVKLGGIELVPESVEIVNPAEAPLPINDQSGVEARLDWRFLDVRTPRNQLFFRVQTTVENATRQFVYARGGTEMHTPKLMATASESGSEVFKVQYFDRLAYLAQSPQFFKQMAISAGIDTVFEIGPVFRAEPSFTSRHATEFTGIDVEMAWIDSVDDVMSFEEQLLAHVLAQVDEKHGNEIRELFGVEVVVPKLPFPRMTMREVRQRLTAAGWKPENDKGDIDPAGERLISTLVEQEFGHEFVFITEYPVGVRPFYHMRPESDPAVTSSFDLIWKGIEITTGAQREHRYDVLIKQAMEKEIPLEPMHSYLDSFRYGTPPHGGLGAGLARILMVMLGLSNIREATFLFRGPHRLEP
jgi:nondiscriminating aspartyl-tRNA synthetase